MLGLYTAAQLPWPGFERCLRPGNGKSPPFDFNPSRPAGRWRADGMAVLVFEAGRPCRCEAKRISNVMSTPQSLSSAAHHELPVSSLTVSVFVFFLAAAPGIIATANPAFCLERVCQSSLAFLVLTVPRLSFSYHSVSASLSGGLPVSACLAWLLALACLANGFSPASSESGRLGIVAGSAGRSGLVALVFGRMLNQFPVLADGRFRHGLA